MALTRANAEAILIRRLGKLLTAAGLDGTTVSGSNGDLNDPVGWAIRQLGLTVSSVVSVTSGDVAQVADTDIDQFLDLAELKALENIAGNLDSVDITLGPQSERLGQLSERVEKAIARKRAQIQRSYGLELGTLDAGVITLDFQQHNIPS